MAPARVPAFLSKLRVEEDDDEKGRTLIWPLVYYSVVLGRTIIVPRGFHTDFASVPRLPLVYVTLGDVGKKAAVVHDFLYRHSGVSRREADKVFYEALKATGQWYWRRALMWTGLRFFGWRAYKPEHPTPVAPIDTSTDSSTGD